MIKFSKTLRNVKRNYNSRIRNKKGGTPACQEAIENVNVAQNKLQERLTQLIMATEKGDIQELAAASEAVEKQKKTVNELLNTLNQVCESANRNGSGRAKTRRIRRKKQRNTRKNYRSRKRIKKTHKNHRRTK